MAAIHKKAGFSVVETIVVVVVLAIIGGLGYALYNHFHTSSDTATSTDQTSTSQPAAASDVQPAPQITTTEDLDKAEQVLDQSTMSSDSDMSQLDTQASGF